MSFWRPQRAGIGSEPDFVDMGHLRYGIPVAVGNRELGCGANSFSGLSPTLSTPRGGGSGPYTQLFPLQDSAADATPDANNLLRLTFDIGGCLRANGIDPTGQQVRLPLEAVTESRPGGTDRAAQTIAVCLPGCAPNAGQGPAGGGGPAPGGPVANADKADLAIDSVVGSDVGGNCQLTAQVANRGTAMAFPTTTHVSVTSAGAGNAEADLSTQNVRGLRHRRRERPDRPLLPGAHVDGDRRQRQHGRGVQRDQQHLVGDGLTAGGARVVVGWTAWNIASWAAAACVFRPRPRNDGVRRRGEVRERRAARRRAPRAASSTSASTRASTSSTPRTCTPAAPRRRSSARRSRAGATGSLATKVRFRMGDGPNDAGLSRAPHHRGLRGQPAPARHRLDRPLPGARVGRPDAARGDARGARHARARRQGPLRRLLELRGLAADEGARRLRAPTASSRFVSQQIYYSLQAREAEYELVPASRRPGRRHPRVEPAGRRPALGQVPPWRRGARGLAAAHRVGRAAGPRPGEALRHRRGAGRDRRGARRLGRAGRARLDCSAGRASSS